MVEWASGRISSKSKLVMLVDGMSVVLHCVDGMSVVLHCVEGMSVVLHCVEDVCRSSFMDFART